MSFDLIASAFWAVLPWLALLACPAMMLWMMRGHSGMACHGRGQQPGSDGPSHDAGRAPAVRAAAVGSSNAASYGTADAVQDEIAELRARLAQLEAERQTQVEARST